MNTLRHLGTAVFGNISWQPPGWLIAAATSARRHTRAITLTALLLVLGGVEAKRAYAWHVKQQKLEQAAFKRATKKGAAIAKAVSPAMPDRTSMWAAQISPTNLEADLHPQALSIYFGRAVAPIDAAGKLVTSGIHMDPPAEGTWNWNGDTQLVFTPKNDWPAGKTYRITVDKSVISPHVNLQSYTVEAHTAAFTAAITKLDFYQEPNNPALKEVVATIEFSHSVAPGELEKYVRLNMENGSTVFNSNGAPFTVKYGQHNRIAYLTSAPITLPEQEDVMKLELDKRLPTAQGGAQLGIELDQRVRIPDVYSFFKIESVDSQIVRNKAGDPEQFVVINTTANAKSADVAKSLELYLLPKKPDPADKPEAGTADKGDDADNTGDTGNTDNTDVEAAAAKEYKDDAGYARGDDDERDDNNDRDDQSDSNTEANSQAPQQYKNTGEVDEDVLKAAKPVVFTVIPSQDENTRQHTFKIKVAMDGTIYLRVRKGVPAAGDFKLGADYDALLPVPQPPREVHIQGDGGVLALNGERKISIESRGVSLIEYEVARIPGDEINHLVSQTEGSFQDPHFLNGSFDETDIARIASEKQSINLESQYKANYSTFDFSKYFAPAPPIVAAPMKFLGSLFHGGHPTVAPVQAPSPDASAPVQGLFLLKASALDPKTKKYISGASERRFILVTDIGLLVKENADGSRDVFVQSIKGRAPLAGVKVDVLARNGTPTVGGVSGADGHVALPALGKPSREKEPVALVARLGNDVSFLPYDRDDRQLDYSRFDVGGDQSTSPEDLDAFVFTERGVYRPGDLIHCAFNVKQRAWGGKGVAGIPVETEVVDARGTSAQVKKIALPEGGVAEFSYQTAYESPTGDYTINVYLVRDGKRGVLIGSTTALLKEFLPDRMKIDSKLSSVSPHGWILPADVTASITLRNLYGTPATNRRIVSKISLDPTGFGFDEYRDYVFYNRLVETQKNAKWQSVELGEQNTDANGEAKVDLDLERFADATYRMNFYAEGFEAEGGRSVNTSCSALVSPLTYVVGCKTDGDLGYLKLGSGHAIELIAIDNNLKKIAVNDLELSVVEESYVSVLQKQDDGTYSYQSVPKENTVLTQPAAITAEGLRYELPTAKAGNYCVVLREKNSKECVSRCEFSVAGDGDVSRTLDKNAELAVKLDRKQYNAGDEVEVSITAPYTGSGLITIEREKVFAYQWFKADTTSTVQKIRLPQDYDGTGYVNVSFIRSLDSKEIFMSPLSYGVAPFTANREKRSLKIDIGCQKIAKPGEPLFISYKTNRPSKIVVFAVDEGILQVTGYEVPDPLAHYFRKYALNVQTSQIVDLIMPEYSVLKSSAFGGDDEAKHLNPFKRVTDKPVVFWSGVLDADSSEHQVCYNVPDYFNGTLSVMAVAMSPDAVGSIEQKSIVRGPFVITPGVPTLAAPGDQFEVGVTVANNVPGSGGNAAVTLTADPSEHLEIVNAPPQPMIIPEGREATALFTVRAKNKPGSASLTFKAATNGQESTLRSTVSVRPAMPLTTDVHGGNFIKDSVTIPVRDDMLPEFRQLETVVSPTPIGLAKGLAVYLKNYPNGCSEQITSGAFCRLMLADDGDFQLSRPELFKQMEFTFSVERRRQNDEGAFGLWAPGPTPNIDFVSAYVMDFLVEAKASGFMPPADEFQNGLRFLQKMAAAQPSNLEEARIVAYAIYTLTREQVITTNYILNLEDYLDKTQAGRWHDDLAGVYLAGSLALLKKDKEAQKLIDGYHMGDPNRNGGWCDFYDALGADSQYVEVVSRHFPETLRRITPQEFHAVTGPISDGDFCTLSAAYAVMALKSYSQHMAANPPALTITAIGKDHRESEVPLVGKFLRHADFPGDAAALRFSTATPVGGMGAFYQVVQTGYHTQLPTKPEADGLEVTRVFLDDQGKETHTAVLGQPLKVRLTIRATGEDAVTNVAIDDLLPGGFEVVGSSLKPGAHVAGCDYVDLREDRNVFFTSVNPYSTTIEYQIKPCNRGQFVVPPIYAASMYNRAIKANGIAGSMTVIDPK